MQLRQTLIMSSINEPGSVTGMNTFFFTFCKAEQEGKGLMSNFLRVFLHVVFHLEKQVSILYRAWYQQVFDAIAFDAAVI